MFSKASLLLCTLAAQGQAETLLGAFVFHRHGDRSAKAWPPTVLTNLGYQQVVGSGNYYRDRWIDASATSQIYGISTDLINNAQLSVTAPVDTVLQDSATGFIQGLYPPSGNSANETLRNGSTIYGPLNGYQLIPIGNSGSSAASEDSNWLQATTGCGAALTSSNEYFSTPQYTDLLSSSQQLYQNILPVINTTFNQSVASYKNAYTIFDYVNVASIHNQSTTFSSYITTDVFEQLGNLANIHEWNLAYNASSEPRAIAGMTLAGQILSGLNTTITGKAKMKLNVQFGNYATFSSFFGLAGLPAANDEFYGITDYASSMIFELVTNASVTSSQPIPSDLSQVAVRFSFHNGSVSSTSEPVTFPLFGSDSTEMPWPTFSATMKNISVTNDQQWCQTCQNTTGTCAAYSSASSSASSTSDQAQTSSDNHLSPAVNGVIGAMVTLVVLLGLAMLFIHLGGFRLVRKAKSSGLEQEQGEVKRVDS